MALRRIDPPTRIGPVRRAYVAFLRTPPGRWIALHIAPRVDPFLLRHSGGRVGLGMMLPSAVLETTGAKSGTPRECTVLYFHDARDVILIASSYGRSANPAWYHNLVAHPDCVLGDDRFRAEQIDEPGERARVWSLADRVYAGYADYRTRAATSGREIPLLRLKGLSG